MTATAMTTAGGTAEIGIVKIMTILGAGGMMANGKNASQRAVIANAKLETAATAVNEATAESEEHAIVSAVSGMEMRGTLTAEIATVGSAMTVGLRRNVRTEASVRMGARGAVTTKRKNVGNARRRRNPSRRRLLTRCVMSIVVCCCPTNDSHRKRRCRLPAKLHRLH